MKYEQLLDSYILSDGWGLGGHGRRLESGVKSIRRFFMHNTTGKLINGGRQRKAISEQRSKGKDDHHNH